MKNKIVILLFLFLGISGIQAKNDMQLNVGRNVCRVIFYTPQIVRIVKYPQSTSPKLDKSIVVIMSPERNLEVSERDKGGKITVESSQLTVSVDKKTGNIQFLHQGKNLLKEKSYALERRVAGVDKDAYKVNVTYQLDKDEPIYGLGTLQDGKLNRRGTTVKLMEQSNLEDYQYVVQSVKGWGIYWDNYSRAKFQDDKNGMSMTAEVGDAVDYYFMYGGSADGVNSCMRQLTGDVPMMPLWTFGYFQSKERYKSAHEVLNVVKQYRNLGVPLDCIVQDWQYWGSNYTWNAMDFLADDYADGKRMIDEVHKQNAKLMISIWASFGPMTKAYNELKRKGLLFNFQTWPQSALGYWPPRMDYPSGVRCYDVYSEEARDIYWKHLKTLFDYGVDAWWMDSTDPDYFNSTDSDYEHITGMGSWRSVRNAFPLCTVKGVYGNQRKTSNDKRVFIMTRSAFAGQQHYGSNMWSGDVASTWDMLRKQIAAGLNFTMTGDPNFNTDIGGFFCGSYNNHGSGSAPGNPQYQELYVRWMQYGLFCPVFRSHGTDAPREIWQFGKKGQPIYDAIEKTINLRYRLIPYLYSTAWQVTSHNQSYLRALVYDYPSDKNVWNRADEFLFGQSVLALPITHPQYTGEKIQKENAMSGWNKKNIAQTSNSVVDFTTPKSTEKYLPEGNDWYDFFTGKKYQGGKTVRLTTTIDHVPMMVKEGSIIPLGPVMQYTGEKKWDNLEILVYPGRNAEFTLYEDEGDNYNYERGLYTTITFHWNDAIRQLTIDNRQGNYPGMLQNRTFKVKVIDSGKTATMSYSGSKVSANF